MQQGEFDNCLPGYVNCDCMRPSNNKCGSGVVTVFLKQSLVDTGCIKRIYNEWNECIVLYVSHELTGLVQDLVLIFTYILPERSVIYENCDDNGIEILNEKITSILSDIPDVCFLLAGDLNARVKNLDDFMLVDEVDYIFQCDTSYPSDSFNTPRSNKDSVLNRFGSSLTELCCIHDVHIFNGQLHRDVSGNFTCTANGEKV